MYLGLPNLLLKKLQRVQNAVARILNVTPRKEHITHLVKDAHREDDIYDFYVHFTSGHVLLEGFPAAASVRQSRDLAAAA